MKFTTVVATILSMAAFAFAAPIEKATRAADNGNHGMCVKGTGGTIEQIANC
ncbi:hypothetical protein CC80DRAFT_412819 [Byssothecium circinans]|uniref:Uncharacterized protein n=1 Tax=Byssothecium circinans TaxID=147558 RepID=A0A6A5TYH4_9PLEO|nr:hypothetical protein CC80DRAFT_412819 [Byssothecium circinans]